MTILSAEDVNTAETPSFTRQIEIRLSRPVPRYRYEKGKAVQEPMPDLDGVLEKVTPELTVALQSLYGPETKVLVNFARSSDIRFQGSFSEKASVMKGIVEDLLSNVLELGED